MDESRYYRFGPWEVACLPHDGGRLSKLRYAEQNLLTEPPVSFRAPQKDYGHYELRPVYGYDDCFPTVDSCPFPESDWMVPDHGELCWMPWKVQEGDKELTFTVRSQKLPITFQRLMRFQDDSLAWQFEVTNSGDTSLPFLHVMHPLTSLSEVTDIELPEFASVVETYRQSSLAGFTSQQMRDWLLSLPEGETAMLFLQGVREARFVLTFLTGVRLEAHFPLSLFPTLAVWWNRGGYPDEEGCRRTECAFEPDPGSNSTLADVYQEGLHLVAPARGALQWTVRWKMTGAGR